MRFLYTGLALALAGALTLSCGRSEDDVYVDAPSSIPTEYSASMTPSEKEPDSPLVKKDYRVSIMPECGNIVGQIAHLGISVNGDDVKDAILYENGKRIPIRDMDQVKYSNTMSRLANVMEEGYRGESLADFLNTKGIRIRKGQPGKFEYTLEVTFEDGTVVTSDPINVEYSDRYVKPEIEFQEEQSLTKTVSYTVRDVCGTNGNIIDTILYEDGKPIATFGTKKHSWIHLTDYRTGTHTFEFVVIDDLGNIIKSNPVEISFDE